MGLSINGAQGILFAKASGVVFSRVAMIGRQRLILKQGDLSKNLVSFGLPADQKTVDGIFRAGGGYAEEFFRFLGATDVHSFDKSDYEGATHVHDMNKPIPAQFKKQYSMVLDGGSLEHVFNFPVALKNCMEMVQVGGHYVALTPANNWMGHGFYQFSPELFFNVLDEVNGYELKHLIAFEDTAKGKWYRVRSPLAVNARVTLINRKRVLLLVVAQRTADIEPFEAAPQQSDYVARWHLASDPGDSANESSNGGAGLGKNWIAFLAGHTPDSIKFRVKRMLRFSQPFNPRFFRRMNPSDAAVVPDRERG